MCKKGCKSKEKTAPVPVIASSISSPTLTETEKLAIRAAVNAALDEADTAGYIDNDAQVTLKDGIATAVGGKNKTHNRGGGHKGSSTMRRTVKTTIGDTVVPVTKKAAVNAYLSETYPDEYYEVKS
jgi:hypothetical protein